MPKPKGGSRPGAGRKQKEPTAVIRVPVRLVEKIKNLINKLKIK
jgi:hypothetical protein